MLCSAEAGQLLPIGAAIWGVGSLLGLISCDENEMLKA
jgi:hypothetical protein